MNEQVSGERIVSLELKYCECCGGLLLRRTGEEAVYCGPCARKVNELPERKISGRGKRDSHASCTNVRRQLERTLPCGEGCGTGNTPGTPGKIGPKSVGIEATEERRLG